MELKKLGLGLASVAVAASLVSAAPVHAAENESAGAATEETTKPTVSADVLAKRAELNALVGGSSLPSGTVFEYKEAIEAATTMDELTALEGKINEAIAELGGNTTTPDVNKDVEAKRAELNALVGGSSLPSGTVFEYKEAIKAAQTMDELTALEGKINEAIAALDGDKEDVDKDVETKKAELKKLVNSSELDSRKVYDYVQAIDKAATMDELAKIEKDIKADLDALDGDKEDVDKDVEAKKAELKKLVNSSELDSR
ncbi:MAG: YSIRK-type signal peptide-containing protein, partial [Aerococcus sp.]|nr:YSIRK-type signal peptide-containing protein [Aerococcus sp.]